MKKLLFTILFISVLVQPLLAQNTISVSGKADLNILPDEVHLLISEKEYYRIEFKGKIFIDYGDYSSNINFNKSLYDSTLPEEKFQFTVADKVYEGKKKDIKYTLVDISTLEDKLIKAAEKAGISKENISISEVGDFWRWRNAPYLITKSYDIKLTDITQFNLFISYIDKQGISSLSFGELKNKEMDEYDKKGRIQALEDAKNKAIYMVEVFNGTLGEPKEIIDNAVPVVATTVIRPRLYKTMANDMAVEESFDDTGGVAGASLQSIDTFPIIKKTYNVNIVFTANY